MLLFQNHEPLNTTSEDNYMKQNKTFSGTSADAMARDYENICPETQEDNSPNTHYHIIGGIMIAAVIVILTTIGIMMYN